MKIDDVLTLAKIGFTKNEILKLADIGDDADPTPEPEPESKPEPKADIEKMSAQESKPEPKADIEKMSAQESKPEPKADDYYSKISAQMAELLSAVQKANIIKDQQPQPMTAEDALASIINPEVKK